jgi:uncharacterized protein (TIGR01370 family)
MLNRNSQGTLLSLCLLCVLLGIVSLAGAQAEDTRTRFDDIESYTVFYGTGRADELAQFDLAIVQPDTLTTEELAALEAEGTIVVAYLSIGEAEPEREWYTDGRVDPAWELGTNENWGSRFIDANQTGWQDLMIELAGESIDKGFDGVFLDTLDTVDLFPETTDGMVEIVRRLRDSYPNAVIVQNRGFTVLDETTEYVDGLMFESLTTSYDFVNQEYISADNGFLANELATLSEETGLVILALDYVEPGNTAAAKNAIERAKSYGFVSAVSVIFLDDIPDYGINAEPEVDIQVKSIDVESDGETTTFVITTENIGLATAPKVSVSLVIDGQQVDRVDYTDVASGQQDQWRYEWTAPAESAAVRATAFSLEDAHAGNNNFSMNYSSDVVQVEPLLPVDEQRRRPAENGPDLTAVRLDSLIAVDGSLDEWDLSACTVVDQADNITFGETDQWTGAGDLSATVCYGWDDDNLYMGFEVTDDVIVQNYEGTDIWRGDHVEIWFDTQLQLDFDTETASDDDFQLGLSPGDFAGVAPSFFIWTPSRLPDTYTYVQYAVEQMDGGYRGELLLPATVLTGLRLAPDHAIGASFDPSDTDTPGGSEQELMLSTAPLTLWGTPHLWNNLILAP